jgi:cell wall-associated NlpC family hydrolase
VSGHHRKLLSLLVAAFVAALTFLTAGPALGAPARSLAGARAAARSATVLPARLRAFDWATTQAGKPYIYGGIGPAGYDCSGLVMEAYLHAGISLPRTTYEMLSSPYLVRVSRPAKGDLAFYGSGHVELYARGDWTFGAHQTGQPVGWIKFGPWWHPTAYYRVR